MGTLFRRSVWLLSLAAAGLVGCSGSTAGPTPPSIKAPLSSAGGPYAGKVGTAVAFSGAGSSDPQGQTLTYAWNFGDNSTGSGVSPTHAYTAAGTFTVSLTVTNTSGLSATGSTTATIVAQPPVANAGGPYSSNIGLAIAFNGVASSDPQGQALTYAWSFGDGAMGTGVNPTHVYTTAGTFTVSLTVTNVSGLTATANTTATITAQPPVANVGGPYAGVAGTAVTFVGSGSSDPQGQVLTYAWTFGDGGTGTGVSPTHTYATPGNYTVSLTVSNTSSLSSTPATTTATITAAPDFTLSASPQSVAISTSDSEVLDLNVMPLNGFTGNVTVKLGTLPSGVTSPSSSYTVVPGIPTQVTLNSTSTVPSTVAMLTLTGTSGTLSHTAQVELTTNTAADYTLTTSTSAFSVVAGETQTMTVTATAVNGFSGTVTGTVTGLPSGLTASPASFSLPLGSSVTVTLVAGSSVTPGNSVMVVGSTSGTTTHIAPVTVNVNALPQDFVLASPVSLTLAPGGTALMNVSAGSIGGFQGTVTVSISGLPSGVTGGSTFHVNLSPALVNSSTLTLTGSPTLTNGTTSFTVTGTANGITHINTVTLTTAPTTTENATVDTSSPGTAFPSYFVGLSLPSQTLTELTGTNSTTATSFINLLRNLSPYIGSPSIRSGLSSTTNSELAALTTGATFTVNGITTSPHFFLTVPSTYTPSTTATEVQAVMNAVGSANLLGLELDNEPDLYSGNGTRPAAWTYQDYLNETAGYQTLFAPYITAPQLVATAASGRSWDPGIPALMTQTSGQLAAYTAHHYALSGCSKTPPTTSALMEDEYTHGFYSQFAGRVQTFGTVPVRLGETNSVACQGYDGVSNALAGSLWVVDMGFEAKAAGTVGFNLQSTGDTSGADPYDIAFNSSNTTSGHMTVYAPYYGLLFFSEAIQNGAKTLPVTITTVAGNIKVWATIDASSTVRVVVLEKDADGLSNTKTVSLNLGSYTKTGTTTTMTAPSLGSTSGITIAGQTFDNTTNGLPTGNLTSSSVTPVNGVYTLSLSDGTATMLTVPK